MGLIDTHAHIDELAAIKEVLERAKATELVAIVAVGSSLTSNMKILELARKYSDFIYPAIGIHPLEAGTNLHEAVGLIDSNVHRCVAIGEIGLDYSYKVNSTRQKQVFESMLDLAKRHRKPVSLHSRGAWDDVLSYVKKHGIREGVFHWYSGSTETLRRILDSGFYISATPAVEYSIKHREAIERTPIERILLETDTPVRYHGVPSEPSDVVKVLNTVAKIKGLAASRLADITTGNASNLFNIQIGSK